MISVYAPTTMVSRAEHVLTVLPQPLMVLQADRRMVFTNPSAERLFADGKARHAAQRLMSVGQIEGAALEQMLRSTGEDQARQAGLWFTPGLQTAWLHASLLAPAVALAAQWPDGCLLVMVHFDQPVLAHGARIEALCRQCRLSNAERYVLLLLADGLTVEAAARQLDVQVSTLRTHVRQLLGKTQAPTLMQLLRWLGSPAPMSA